MDQHTADMMGGLPAYPAETPQAANDAQQSHGPDQLASPEREPESFNWAMTASTMVAHKDADHSLMLEMMQHGAFERPHAMGSLTLMSRWDAVFEITKSNMAFHVIEKRLRRYCKEHGWKYKGVIGDDGMPFSGESVKTSTAMTTVYRGLTGTEALEPELGQAPCYSVDAATVEQMRADPQSFIDKLLALGRRPLVGDNSIGWHWTLDPERAKHYAVGGKHPAQDQWHVDQGFTTSWDYQWGVVIEAQIDQSQHAFNRDTDFAAMNEQGATGVYHHEVEQEITVKAGSPIQLVKATLLVRPFGSSGNEGQVIAEIPYQRTVIASSESVKTSARAGDGTFLCPEHGEIPGSKVMDDEQGFTCFWCGQQVKSLRRTSMADRSGVPEVDQLIEDFLKEPVAEYGGQSPETIMTMRDPQNSHGMCQAVTEQFVEFAKARGFKAYSTDTDLDEMGYKTTIEPFGEIGFDDNDQMQHGFYNEHTIATIVLAKDEQHPYGREIYIDFTASQYGYSDHPKVSKTAGATTVYRGLHSDDETMDAIAADPEGFVHRLTAERTLGPNWTTSRALAATYGFNKSRWPSPGVGVMLEAHVADEQVPSGMEFATELRWRDHYEDEAVVQAMPLAEGVPLTVVAVHVVDADNPEPQRIPLAEGVRKTASGIGEDSNGIKDWRNKWDTAEDVPYYGLSDPSDEGSMTAPHVCPDCQLPMPGRAELRQHMLDEHINPSRKPSIGPVPVVDYDAVLPWKFHDDTTQPWRSASMARIAAKHSQRQAAPKVEIPGPIPVLYDVESDRIYVGHPGERHSDIKGKFTPGGVIEGVYDPKGNLQLRTDTDMPYSIYHLTRLWYAMFPELEIKGIFRLVGDDRYKLASANVGHKVRNLLAADAELWAVATDLAKLGSVYAVGDSVRDIVLGRNPEGLQLIAQVESDDIDEIIEQWAPTREASVRMPSDIDGREDAYNTLEQHLARHKTVAVNVVTGELTDPYLLVEKWIGLAARKQAQDYRMNHQPTEEGAPLHDLTDETAGVFPPDVYDHPEWYGAAGDAGAAETVAVIKSVRGNPEAMVTIYRGIAPIDSRIPEHGNTINTGDWVALADAYARTHALHHENPQFDGPVLSAQVPAHTLRSEGYLTEWGYFGPPLSNVRTSANKTSMPYATNVWYHTTSPEMAQQIAQQGLVGRAESGKSNFMVAVKPDAVYLWPEIQMAENYAGSDAQRLGDHVVLRVMGIDRASIWPDHEEFREWLADEATKEMSGNSEGVDEMFWEVERWGDDPAHGFAEPLDSVSGEEVEYSSLSRFMDTLGHEESTDLLSRLPADLRVRLAEHFADTRRAAVMFEGSISPQYIEVAEHQGDIEQHRKDMSQVVEEGEYVWDDMYGETWRPPQMGWQQHAPDAHVGDYVFTPIQQWVQPVTARTAKETLNQKARRIEELGPNPEYDHSVDSEDASVMVGTGHRVLRHQTQEGINWVGKAMHNCWQDRDLRNPQYADREHQVIYDQSGSPVAAFSGYPQLKYDPATGKSRAEGMQYDQLLGERNKQIRAGTPEHDAFLSFLNMQPDGTKGEHYEWNDGEPSNSRYVVGPEGVRTAGANGDLPEGLTFETHEVDDWPPYSIVSAKTSDLGEIGWVEIWTGGKLKGQIKNINVSPAYRRLGIASALYEAAGAPQHSRDLTDNGKAWKRSVGSTDGMTFHRETAGHGYANYTAYIGGELAGTLTTERNGEVEKVSMVEVVPEFARTGVATALWDYVTEHTQGRVRHADPEARTEDGTPWVRSLDRPRTPRTDFPPQVEQAEPTFEKGDSVGFESGTGRGTVTDIRDGYVWVDWQEGGGHEWQLPTSIVKLGNILDDIKPALNEAVFDKSDDQRPEVKKGIRSWVRAQVFRTMREAGWPDPTQYLSLVLTGSLTTYQWSDESDFDISLFVDTERFPDWVRSDLIALMVKELDGKTVPGTTHPLQVYVVPHGITREKLYQPGTRSGYDLDTGKWIVPPDRSMAKDVKSLMPKLIAYCRMCEDKLRTLLKYNKYAAADYWHLIHERRASDMRAGRGDFSASNVLYKWIANAGLHPAISEATGEYIAKASAWTPSAEQHAQFEQNLRQVEVPGHYPEHNSMQSFNGEGAPDRFISKGQHGVVLDTKDKHWDFNGKPYSSDDVVFMTKDAEGTPRMVVIPERHLAPFSLNAPDALPDHWTAVKTTMGLNGDLPQLTFKPWVGTASDKVGIEALATAPHPEGNDGYPVGHITLRRSEKQPEAWVIDLVKVSEEWRRRGVGQALLQEARKEFGEVLHDMERSSEGLGWSQAVDPEVSDPEFSRWGSWDAPNDANEWVEANAGLHGPISEAIGEYIAKTSTWPDLAAESSIRVFRGVPLNADAYSTAYSLEHGGAADVWHILKEQSYEFGMGRGGLHWSVDPNAAKKFAEQQSGDGWEFEDDERGEMEAVNIIVRGLVQPQHVHGPDDPQLEQVEEDRASFGIDSNEAELPVKDGSHITILGFDVQIPDMWGAGWRYFPLKEAEEWDDPRPPTRVVVGSHVVSMAKWEDWEHRVQPSKWADEDEPHEMTKWNFEHHPDTMWHATPAGQMGDGVIHFGTQKAAYEAMTANLAGGNASDLKWQPHRPLDDLRAETADTWRGGPKNWHTQPTFLPVRVAPHREERMVDVHEDLGYSHLNGAMYLDDEDEAGDSAANRMVRPYSRILVENGDIEGAADYHDQRHGGSGYWYQNETEDIGSTSGVVPHKSWLWTHEDFVKDALKRGINLDDIDEDILNEYPHLRGTA